MSRAWKKPNKNLPGYDYERLGRAGGGKRVGKKKGVVDRPKKEWQAAEAERFLVLRDLYGRPRGVARFVKQNGVWYVRKVSTAARWLERVSMISMPEEIGKRGLVYEWREAGNKL